MGNYLCRKRSINDSGRRTDISGRCGREFITLAEPTTCWGGGFSRDLKFYWLHFEVKAPDNDPRWLTHLSVPQQTKVVDPQALVALFRQFLSEQEKHQRTPALEFIVLLILQQLTRDARLDEQADGAGTPLAWKAQKLIRTQYHRPLSTALLARELYCNADYLGRVYRRVFHLTLTEAIHRQRVREAEKLLISEARSLTEVAALCGLMTLAISGRFFANTPV